MRPFTIRWDEFRPIWLIGTGLAATVLATVVLWSAQFLETKWLISLLVGLTILWLALLSGHFERFMLALLFLIIPVNADYHFGLEDMLYALQLPPGTHLLRISVSDVVLATLYFIWLLRLFRARQSPQRQERLIIWPSGATLIWCFIGWAALSIINAQNHQLSFFLLVEFVKAFLLFFYVANHVKTRKDLWFIVCCLLAGLFLECFIAFAQRAAGGNLGLPALGERSVAKEVALSAGNIFRVGGTLGHPNYLGGYLASVLPVALAAAVVQNGKWMRAVTFGIFLSGILVLVLTFSRSAWVVTGAALPVLVGRALLERRKTLRPKHLLIAVLAAAILFAPFAYLIKARWVEDDKGATASRLPRFQIGWSVVKSHPILGVGLNNYSLVAHLYETHVTTGRSDHRKVFLYYGEAHNVFLTLAAETGLVGLFWMVWFVGLVGRRGWQAIKSSQDAVLRLLLFGMLLGFFARIPHDAFHTGNLATHMFLWIYAACLVSPIRDPGGGS